MKTALTMAMITLVTVFTCIALVIPDIVVAQGTFASVVITLLAYKAALDMVGLHRAKKRKNAELAQLREKFRAVQGKPLVVLPNLAETEAKRRQVEAEDSSPAAQVRRIGAEHGLPVITVLQKDVALPFATAPSVTSGQVLVSYVGSVPLAQKLEAFRELAKPEPAYVPAGQEELSRELMLTLVAQVDAAAREHSGASPLTVPGLAWYIGPAWLEEVRKLRWPAGDPVYVPRTRTAKWQSDGLLLGYRVITGEAYGIPELR